MASFARAALSFFLLASSVSAAPTYTTSSQSVCNAGETGNVTAQVFYDLYAEKPDLVSSPASGWHIEAYNNKSQHEQLVIFPTIPTGATKCTIKFHFANLEERDFIVKGNGPDFGFTKLRQISKLPDTWEGFTYNVIEELDDKSGKESSNNVQNWDLPEQKGSGWTLGEFECSDRVAFRSWLSNVSSRKEDQVDTAHVFLGANDKNGFTLNYTC